MLSSGFRCDKYLLLKKILISRHSQFRFYLEKKTQTEHSVWAEIYLVKINESIFWKNGFLGGCVLTFFAFIFTFIYEN